MLWLLLLQVSASCLWLGHSEVVTPFASCPQFFYQGTPPNDALMPNNPVRICQRYRNQYRFATLYDRNRRIPVYSAYIYQPGPSPEPPLRWFVEPQLINPYPKDMKTEDFLIKQIGQNQAINQDYKNLTGLDRGQLSPSSHQSDYDSKVATFTLTNIMPQNSTLNQDAWQKYENQTMQKQTKGCTTTYVITGAVPGNKSIAKGRVNVPSYIWSAACCVVGQNPTRTWAVVAKNDKNQVQ
ncbi:ENDD1 protein, partial [Origma solitaria]|nr:ENDD1 protein [Origma solitaria]